MNLIVIRDNLKYLIKMAESFLNNVLFDFFAFRLQLIPFNHHHKSPAQKTFVSERNFKTT